MTPDISLGLVAPWDQAFELAWESFQAGSPPVGAVIVDGDGRVVASGRSRRHEAAAPTGQLAGSRLAHAEINALALLGLGDHRDLTLYTTLQSCLLCTSATAMSYVGSVIFAGADPVWDCLALVPAVDDILARRWPIVEGPVEGALSQWASILALLDLLPRRPDGDAVAAYRSRSPELVTVVEQLVAHDELGRLRSLPMVEAALICLERVETTS